MKKPAVVVLLVAVLVLLVTSGYLLQRYRQTSAAYVETKAAEETVRGQYGEAITAIAEIQENLNAIDLEEDVRLLAEDVESGPGVTRSRKDQIVGRITDLKESVEHSKERIRLLESTLRESRVKIADFERVIASLKENVAQKERLIAQLSSKVETLEVRVAGLQTEVAGLQTEVRENQEHMQAQERTIEEKQRELSTIYYIVGTKKDLLAKGVIENRGGFVGIGKTAQLTAGFDERAFTALDTDVDRVIRVPSVKVQVLSAQPRTSYSINLLQGRSELTILDRREFRKVKYLVILVA
ncbi:MAG: hypothetical protein V1774_07070 [Candidatus Eisenbacteria bacterium]